MAVVAFLIAASAARAAFKQYQLGRETRADQTRPYVIVDFEPSPASSNLMDLIVRNIGTTPAYDVKVRLSPTPARARETTNFELSKARILDGTLPMFAPGRELRMFFDSMPERYEAKLPMSFECSVTYKDGRKAIHNEKSTVDMDVARGMLRAEIYGVHHVAKALREIKTDIHRSPLRKGPIHVVTESRDDYGERQRAGAEQARQAHEELMSHVEYVSDDAETSDDQDSSTDGQTNADA